MARPAIIVSGNCQTGVFAHALQRIPWVAERFDMLHEPIDYRPNEPIEVTPEDWARCAIFWRQIGLSRAAAPSSDGFKPGKTVTFPPLDFLPLWPFTAWDPLFQPEPDYPTSMYPEPDGLVAEISETEPAELDGAAPDWLQLFDALSARSVATLERSVEAEAQRLVARDLQTDVQVAGYLMSHFRSERLFYTRNHPTPTTLIMLLKRLLAATWPGEIGADKALHGAAESAFADWNPFAHYQVPVNRRVAEKLGLSWWREDMRYRTDASVRSPATQTADEYFLTYITRRRERWLARRA